MPPPTHKTFFHSSIFYLLLATALIAIGTFFFLLTQPPSVLPLDYLEDISPITGSTTPSPRPLSATEKLKIMKELNTSREDTETLSSAEKGRIMKALDARGQPDNSQGLTAEEKLKIMQALENR